MEEIFYLLAKALEVVSFSIMIYGAILAVFLFLKNELSRFSGKFHISSLNKIRMDYGYYILLGLEFLIAADLIETILRPTSQELIELGGIVAIRILMSYFLTKEINELKASKAKSDNIAS